MKGILTAATAALMLLATATATAAVAGAQATRGVDTAITSLRAKQGAKSAAKPTAARVTINAGKVTPAAPTVVPRLRSAAADSANKASPARTAPSATGRSMPAAPAHAARPGRKKG